MAGTGRRPGWTVHTIRYWRKQKENAMKTFKRILTILLAFVLLTLLINILT